MKPDAENGRQLRSQSLGPVNVLALYASGPSLPAALLNDHFEQSVKELQES